MENIYFSSKKVFNNFLRYVCLMQIICLQLNTKAQVIPDQTLGVENSKVQNTGNQILIDGGSSRGNNLFHSFNEFSLDKQKSAVFRARNNIINIFSRITGKQASIIDGVLSASGNANLFIINPNGISIGQNARLDINGSFLATTSDKFIFNYLNTEFNLLEGDLIPNELVSFDSINLVFTNNTSTISITNTGHNNTIDVFSPINEVLGPGFSVKPGRSLGFFGSNISSNGGIVSAPSGSLAVGSIANGNVSIRYTNSKFEIDFVGNPTFGDIRLKNRSSFSANSGGEIKLFGRNIDIFSASSIYSSNQFNKNSGSIDIYASELLNIRGRTQDTGFRSSIFSDTTKFGIAPIINIKSKNIFVSDSAYIGVRLFDQGKGGEVNVNALDSINIIGSNKPRRLELSAIFATTIGSNNSGDVNINSKTISLQQGGSIVNTSTNKGNAGNLKVSASESINIVGFAPQFLESSTISAASLGIGDGGNISVNTGELVIAQGGSINSSILNKGNAGIIDINATKSITLSGLIQSKIESNNSGIMPAQTTINSNAVISPIFQPIFNAPLRPSGNSGQVIISSPVISVNNGATIGTFNQGTGTAGDLTINAGRIELNDSGSISASTFSGSGGNVQILTEQLILDNGVISAAAFGDGIGGNIEINADLFTSFGNSSVSANAFNNQGGNINFKTTGFFPSPDTTITATSALGTQFSGTVTFSNPDTDLELSKVTLDTEVSKPEVSSICRPTSNSFSEFIVSGEGGLPTGPSDSLSENSGWHDALGGSEQTNTDNAKVPDLVDAQGWVKNSDGTFSLVASTSLPITTAEISTPCNAQVQNTDSTFSNPSASLSADTLSTRSHSTSANPSPTLASR